MANIASIKCTITTQAHAKFCREGINNSSSNSWSSTKKGSTRGHSYNVMHISCSILPLAWPGCSRVFSMHHPHSGLKHIDVIDCSTSCLYLFVFVRSNERQINIKQPSFEIYLLSTGKRSGWGLRRADIHGCLTLAESVSDT